MDIKMKRLLYLTTWDFSDGASSGITNKIKAQIKAFESYGFLVDYTCISNGKTILCKDGQSVSLGRVGKFRKLAANFYLTKRLKQENYDYIYSRYGLADVFYLKLLKIFAKKNAKIVVEIPSYPYDKECMPGIVWWMLYALDKACRRKLGLYVNRIATYSEDKYIFNIPTINIYNGIDFSTVKIREPMEPEPMDGIHLIAVAAFAKWHGYDRLLVGLGEYYSKAPQRRVIFHLVGDGAVRKEYEEIVSKYNIQPYVIFHGMKFGKELDELYNLCDIGVENLGSHRSGIYHESTLKSREYGAKGLPFITSCIVDGFNDAEFVLKFQPNENSIDVEKIVMFYDLMYNGVKKEKIASDIRKLAEQKCSMKQVIEPIVNYYQE